MWRERKPEQARGLLTGSDFLRKYCSVVVSTAAGIVGALLAGRLLAPLLGGVPSQGFFSVSALLGSLLGAVVLVALVNLLRRGRLR